MEGEQTIGAPIAYAWGTTEKELERLRQRIREGVPDAEIVALDQLEQAPSDFALIVRGNRGDNQKAVARFLAWADEQEEQERFPTPILLYSTDREADDALWPCHDGLIDDQNLTALTDYLTLPQRRSAQLLAARSPATALKELRATGSPDEPEGLELPAMLLQMLDGATRERLERDALFRLTYETALLEELDEASDFEQTFARLKASIPTAPILEQLTAWLATVGILLRGADSTSGIRLTPALATVRGNEEDVREDVGIAQPLFYNEQFIPFTGPNGRGDSTVQWKSGELTLSNVRDTRGRRLNVFVVELRASGAEGLLSDERALLWQGDTNNGLLTLPEDALRVALQTPGTELIIRPSAA